MLDRAEKKRPYVDTFIYELGLRESNLSKRAKIDELRLSSDEWDRVTLFTSLLVVRSCQQSLILSMSLTWNHLDGALAC